MTEPTYLLPTEWGATSVGVSSKMKYLPAKYIVFHHTVTTATTNAVADFLTVEGIGISRFGRLSYSWMFHPDGTIGEGQGTYRGAHTVDEKGYDNGSKVYGMNDRAFSFSAIGDYTKNEPTEAMLDSFAWAIVRLLDLGLLADDYVLAYHGEFKATACPGAIASIIPQVEARVAQLLNQDATDEAPQPPTVITPPGVDLEARSTAEKALDVAQRARTVALSNRGRIADLENRVTTNRRNITTAFDKIRELQEATAEDILDAKLRQALQRLLLGRVVD